MRRQMSSQVSWEVFSCPRHIDASNDNLTQNVKYQSYPVGVDEELGWATLALAGRVTGIGDDKRVNTFQVHGPRLGAHWPRGDRAAYPGRALDGRDDGAGPCPWEMVKIPSPPQRVSLQL